MLGTEPFMLKSTENHQKTQRHSKKRSHIKNQPKKLFLTEDIETKQISKTQNSYLPSFQVILISK